MPTLQKLSPTSSRNLSSMCFWFVRRPRDDARTVSAELLIVFLADTISHFLSNPSCIDIMEIYNEVEEMDDDDEVSLNHLTTSLCSWWVCFVFSCTAARKLVKSK